jgi:hypothetical protein
LISPAASSIMIEDRGPNDKNRRAAGRDTMLGELDSHIENRNMRSNNNMFDLNAFDG